MIFLIGHAACGKTTLGRALHERTGVRFVDLDQAVERSAGMTVPEIFATQGETAFRALEAEALEHVCALYAGHDAVVACGGGTPCRPGAMDLMLRSGTVVRLSADRDITLRRLREAEGQRPRLAGLSDAALIAALDADARDREPSYSRATATFDSSRLDTEEQVNETVTLFINEFMQ